MPQHSERLTIGLPLDQVHAGCQRAVAEMGWRVFNQQSNMLICKEIASKATSTTWPVEIQVKLTSIAQGTGIEVFGSNFGFGPIQKGHVRGQVGNFVNRLQACLQQTQQVAAVPQQAPIGVALATELEKLAKLHQSGSLTDEEFSQAKQYLLNNLS